MAWFPTGELGRCPQDAGVGAALALVGLEDRNSMYVCFITRLFLKGMCVQVTLYE